MTNNNYGWICPRCDKVHAPSVERCDCYINPNMPRTIPLVPTQPFQAFPLVPGSWPPVSIPAVKTDEGTLSPDSPHGGWTIK